MPGVRGTVKAVSKSDRSEAAALVPRIDAEQAEVPVRFGGHVRDRRADEPRTLSSDSSGTSSRRSSRPACASRSGVSTLSPRRIHEAQFAAVRRSPRLPAAGRLCARRHTRGRLDASGFRVAAQSGAFSRADGAHGVITRFSHT